MPSTPEQKELRIKGRQVLETVLKQEKNIKIVEKYIYKNAGSTFGIDDEFDNYKEHYNKVIYQTIGDIILDGDLKSIIVNIKKGLVGWEHPAFTDIKNMID